MQAIATAAARAGLAEHLSAIAGALALVNDLAPHASWSGARWMDQGTALLERCQPLAPADADALRVSARARAMLRQPVRVTLAFLRSRLFPSRALLEQIHHLRPGSPFVGGAWAVHVGKLVVRSGDDVLRLWRLRRARRQHPSSAGRSGRRP
jgi:hypothetical protein